MDELLDLLDDAFESFLTQDTSKDFAASGLTSFKVCVLGEETAIERFRTSAFARGASPKTPLHATEAEKEKDPQSDAVYADEFFTSQISLFNTQVTLGVWSLPGALMESSDGKELTRDQLMALGRQKVFRDFCYPGAELYLICFERLQAGSPIASASCLHLFKEWVKEIRVHTTITPIALLVLTEETSAANAELQLKEIRLAFNICATDNINVYLCGFQSASVSNEVPQAREKFLEIIQDGARARLAALKDDDNGQILKVIPVTTAEEEEELNGDVTKRRCQTCQGVFRVGQKVRRCLVECRDHFICFACFAESGHEHATCEERITYFVDDLWRIQGTNLAQTIKNVLLYFKTRAAFGMRQVNSSGRPEGPFAWQTYGELQQQVTNFGSGLKGFLKIPSRSHVGICLPNSINWFVADLSLILYDMVGVILHASTSIEDLVPIINHAELTCLVTSLANLRGLIEFEKDTKRLSGSTLRTIIVVDDALSEEEFACEFGRFGDDYPGLCAQLFSRVAIAGAKLSLPFQDSAPSSLLNINFTSGSTGMPKGVMITNTIWNRELTDQLTLLNSSPTLFTHQPLSAAARVNSYRNFVMGKAVGVFGRRFDETFFEDVCMIKPMVLSCVPLVWEYVYASYKQCLDKYFKEASLSTDSQSPSMEEVELRVLKHFASDYFGGKLSVLGTGGAATRGELVEFLEKFGKVGIAMLDSYGATEVGSIFVNGLIPLNVTFKLADVPDMDFFSTDTPYPRGELLVKTARMFEGYYKNERDTSAALDSDGWYRTGDIVRQVDERRIEIIDRLKDLFKLAQGEYVSPQRVEFALLSASPLIEQICVVGHRHASFLVALVYPKAAEIAKALGLNLSTNDIHGENKTNISSSTAPSIGIEELTKRKDVTLLLLNEIWNISKFAKLRNCETIKRIALISSPFSIQDGTLTHTHKLCRHRIEKHYAREINLLYDGEIIANAEFEIGERTKSDIGVEKLTTNENSAQSATRQPSDAIDQETREAYYEILRSIFPSGENDISLLSQDFLSVGGNSISAVKFVEALNVKFGPVISLASIFQERLSLAHILTIILATRKAKSERNGEEVMREMQLIDESLDEVDIFQNDLRPELLGDLTTYRV